MAMMTLRLRFCNRHAHLSLPVDECSDRNIHVIVHRKEADGSTLASTLYHYNIGVERLFHCQRVVLTESIIPWNFHRQGNLLLSSRAK